MKKTKTTVETKPSKSAGKPSKGVVHQYELVVIYPTTENEVGVEKTITEKCKKRALKVVSVDKWGTKTLAYEIKKQSRGYYLMLIIEGSSESLQLLEKDLQMDDKMLRFLMIRI